MEAKRTPLYDCHVKHGGRLVEFAGWMLPVQFSGILEEHRAVRERAGLFDVSHMGQISVKGPGTQAFLQRLLTQRIDGPVGRTQYSLLCAEDGGVLDDLLVYRPGEQEYLLVVNAANVDSDWEWIASRPHPGDVTLANVSAQYAQLALQGPEAMGIFCSLAQGDAAIKPFRHRMMVVNGCEMLVSRTGYTGEDGVECYLKPGDAPALWEAFIAAGAQPCGLGARDTLRFECAMTLYGHELARDITPLEAGLASFVKLDKGEFIGRGALQAQAEAGVPRMRIGLEMVGRGIARQGYPVWAGGRQVGVVTSGMLAPTVGKNLAMALVDSAAADLDALAVEIRGNQVEARRAELPFYTRKRKEG